MSTLWKTSVTMNDTDWDMLRCSSYVIKVFMEVVLVFFGKLEDKAIQDTITFSVPEDVGG